MYASKNFKWSELACKCGCGTSYVSKSAIIKLQKLRDMMGSPITINSCCRCPLHNARVGGVPNSQHRSTLTSPTTAFDIALDDHDKQFLIDCAVKAGFKGIGINYKTFVHVDDRERYARW